MRIAILYICTGKYDIFWKDFYSGSEKYFLTDTQKHYFVFTDAEKIFNEENKNIHKIYQKNLGWPDNTLMRFDIFSNIISELNNFDYIFFFNADLCFLKDVNSEEFIPLNDKNLLATIHPGYFNKKNNKFQYERNNLSTAFIPQGSGEKYFAGGLNGGKTKYFVEAILKIKENINIDKKNKITAVWNDESHWNNYLLNRKDIKILDPGYLYPESSNIKFDKKIMIRDKRKYFNYQQIGKENINKNMNTLKTIKKNIEEIKFIQHSTFWYLIKKWINRLNLLKTIYRNKKNEAVKSYIKNDFEYTKIKKEINKFKFKDIYNFNGIKLPLCIVTPDTFLNVIKPYIEKIDYNEKSINDFYQSQQEKYKTLHYWKDSYLDKEPDFIGGHIISHGFTYLFEEVIVKNNDVVIDLGAAPGDFSALCVLMGASKVYAFEPEEGNSSNLKKTSELNGNKIEIIRKYCSDVINQNENIITIDEFVKINNIKKIDFIKSDIEGSETKALIGAKNTLKNHKPKLSFCTYHTKDDENTIERAILDANPDYKIYKNKGIIYAY